MSGQVYLNVASCSSVSAFYQCRGFCLKIKITLKDLIKTFILFIVSSRIVIHLLDVINYQ